MGRFTPEVSKLLDQALALSPRDRGLVIGCLIESLDDECTEEDAEQAWEQEIRRRVGEIRSGKAATIPGDQLLQELAEKFPDDE